MSKTNLYPSAQLQPIKFTAIEEKLEKNINHVNSFVISVVNIKWYPILKMRTKDLKGNIKNTKCKLHC